MKLYAAVTDGFSRWIDAVASTFAIMLDGVASPRVIHVTEGETGEFVIETIESSPSTSKQECIQIVEGQILHPPEAMKAVLSGSHIELRLRPDRFLFRPLELPSRADEFMHGIVQAQINRLTPWNPADAAFGWSTPVEAGPERIVVTIAATALNFVKPYVRALADFGGAASIAVFTTLPDAHSAGSRIKVWEEKVHETLEIGRIRQALVIVLVAAFMFTGTALGVDYIARANVKAQQNQLERQIADIRGAANDTRKNKRSIATAQRILEKRKIESSPATIVVETLARILPDNTYVTELRIEGDKLRITGITRDAPALVGLIEQSGRFKRANFFAPTTRSGSDPADHFHIEATIQPLGSSS
jgi:general secretion pathway protein L